jgi:hypothetical protein
MEEIELAKYKCWRCSSEVEVGGYVIKVGLEVERVIDNEQTEMIAYFHPVPLCHSCYLDILKHLHLEDEWVLFPEYDGWEYYTD